jgi:hypothetical protein
MAAQQKTRFALSKHQQGLGFVGWLVVVLIVGIIAMQAFKLFPAYVESITIRSQLNEMAQLTDGVEDLTNREIRTRLGNFFRVNAVSKEASSSLDVTRSDGHVVIEMEYERRVSMFYNIDLVMSFHHRLNSKFPDQCCSP